MNYTVNYQYHPKTSARPHDDGEVVPFNIKSKDELVLLPNLGDYVHVGATNDYDGFYGEVSSRLFNYQETSTGEVYCNINIVVKETAQDFGLLIKE